jgi:hypothetical protein
MATHFVLVRLVIKSVHAQLFNMVIKAVQHIHARNNIKPSSSREMVVCVINFASTLRKMEKPISRLALLPYVREL